VSAAAIAEELTAERVERPAGWTTRVRAAIADGWRFAGLQAADETHVRAAFERDGRVLALECRTPDGTLPTVIDVVPAAQWDEREAHDLHGVVFDGHEPMRPLVRHPADLAAWTTPVDGHDPYQVVVGPTHAGVIESGHFRFHVVGERVLALDLRLFYKHRGLEAAAVGRPAADGLAHAQRACGACAVANAVAFAHAYESARGLWPEPELRRARTLLLELERLYNHLNDLSAVCAGVGFAAGTMAFAALKERAQRLNARLAGHRFLFGAVRLGASELTIGRDNARVAAEELATLGAELATLWRQLRFANSVQERFAGVATLTAADALRLGAVGPTARASGVADDLRTRSPRLAYDGFAPAVPDRATGDVAARVEQRALELDATLALLARLLERRLAPARAEAAGAPARPLGAGLVESPRGATLCLLELDGEDAVVGMRLRTGSYANWPALVHVVPGNPLPDFPLINKSFELCYACVDR
jgi:Ni,Fe-hydrogenase III large subunit